MHLPLLLCIFHHYLKTLLIKNLFYFSFILITLLILILYTPLKISLQNFSILTYNSNSLFRGDTVKSKILYDESHQIVTCVDTRVSLPQAQRLARSFSKTSKIGERNERIFSTVQQDGERHTGGVLIRFGSNILSGDPEETIIDDSPDKRYMAMVAPLTNGARILICVIYLSPNGPMAARTQLVDEINDKLTDMRDRLKPDVVCITGDLNTSLDNNEKNKKLNTSIRAMLYTLDLEDSFRDIHPSADAHSGATFSCRTSIQQTTQDLTMYLSPHTYSNLATDPKFSS